MLRSDALIARQDIIQARLDLIQAHLDLKMRDFQHSSGVASLSFHLFTALLLEKKESAGTIQTTTTLSFFFLLLLLCEYSGKEWDRPRWFRASCLSIKTI
jgi:hypothetical protein